MKILNIFFLLITIILLNPKSSMSVISNVTAIASDTQCNSVPIASKNNENLDNIYILINQTCGSEGQRYSISVYDNINLNKIASSQTWFFQETGDNTLTMDIDSKGNIYVTGKRFSNTGFAVAKFTVLGNNVVEEWTLDVASIMPDILKSSGNGVGIVVGPYDNVYATGLVYLEQYSSVGTGSIYIPSNYPNSKAILDIPFSNPLRDNYATNIVYHDNNTSNIADDKIFITAVNTTESISKTVALYPEFSQFYQTSASQFSYNSIISNGLLTIQRYYNGNNETLIFSSTGNGCIIDIYKYSNNNIAHFGTVNDITNCLPNSSVNIDKNSNGVVFYSQVKQLKGKNNFEFFIAQINPNTLKSTIVYKEKIKRNLKISITSLVINKQSNDIFVSGNIGNNTNTDYFVRSFNYNKNRLIENSPVRTVSFGKEDRVTDMVVSTNFIVLTGAVSEAQAPYTNDGTYTVRFDLQ